MLRRVSPAFVVVILLGATSSHGQQAQQVTVVKTNAPQWVVSVVHAIDSNKMIARLRQQENVRVGVPGTAPPQKLINITTGLVIDGSGHVVTRLTNLDPGDKDETIQVILSTGSRLRALLVGIDCATGFAVLEVPSLKLALPGFAPTSVLSQGMAVKILSADVTAKMTAADNSTQLSIDYSIKQDLGRVGVGSTYARARNALTLNSGNLLSRNDGSIAITFDNQVAGIAQYAGYGRAYLFPFEFIRDVVAKRVIDKQDSVPGGWLGVRVDGLTQLSDSEFSALGLPRKSGVIVREVMPDSAAAASGMKRSDVIVGLNEFDINSKTDFSAVLSSLPAAQSIKLRLIRSHDNVEVVAVLGARPCTGQMVYYLEPDAPDESLSAQLERAQRRLDELREQYRANMKNPPSAAREETRFELEIEMRQNFDRIRDLQQQAAPAQPLVSNDVGSEPDIRLVLFSFDAGFSARDLDRAQEPQLAEFFGITKGVLVVSVVKGSPAERTGIRAGDVILGTYHNSGLNCQQLNTTLSSRRGIITLKILREKKPVMMRFVSRAQ